MNRNKIALQVMLALIPVYWDTVDEYESADELIESNIKCAFEYADAFLKEIKSNG